MPVLKDSLVRASKSCRVSGYSTPRLTFISSIPTGSVQDLASIAAALEGAYGVFVNTDSWTLSEAQEVFAGMRIFELAKGAGTVRHYVWSSLDNVVKVRPSIKPAEFNC